MRPSWEAFSYSLNEFLVSENFNRGLNFSGINIEVCSSLVLYNHIIDQRNCCMKMKPLFKNSQKSWESNENKNP